MIDHLPTQTATYKDSENEFELEILIQEMDKSLRVSARDRLVASSVQGVVADDDRVKRGGRIFTEDNEFRIDKAAPSEVPGLKDLSMDRRNGDPVMVADATDLLPMEDVVSVNGGDPVEAHVQRSVAVEEVRNGSRVVVYKTMVSIRFSDVPKIKSGDRLTLNEQTKTISSRMFDGLGYVKVIV